MHNSLTNLIEKFPLIPYLQRAEPVFWLNNQVNATQEFPFTMDIVYDAEARLKRFAPYFKAAFSEIRDWEGIIESPIIESQVMQTYLESAFQMKIEGNLLLKCDHMLPIAGSVKARGGIYEIIKHAEHLAIRHGLLSLEDDYRKLNDESFRQFFKNYKIAVGSTGNLGLSIGIISAKLGFNVTVHMSADAKEWKKQLLRNLGVTVIEYEADYSEAVKQGRLEAEQDETCHFVDDENSLDLFAGYAVAALRVKEQLEEQKINVDQEHPLFVYIPCGVGGAPGGISYGLKQLYGPHVHIFFAEPTQSPCMLLGMMTGLHDEIDVKQIGLTNVTEADGLAVGRASKFVGAQMETIVSGCYTVEDSFLFTSLRQMYCREHIFMEPSAHAGFFGPIQLARIGAAYIDSNGLKPFMQNAHHLVWSTGGDLVPNEWRDKYLQK
ncbi:D-serine ammonia-lyase [Metasolibacillus fluoroglycofenilyticus]|uniref:D-serine ammonia-lyase n=1 Tax=Metasolibacillus fluoroglycofenilyticus TaxID=1239396 RepID=UPI000D34CF0D|nr:D-serine ammonia-lyase [Metasolibacillus fluoroglycofenilyticus]